MHNSFLRYFDEVARQGSIRKAAALLKVSSTSVNRKIIATEDVLGIRLFDRTSEGVSLTDAGSVVLEHCRQTLFEFDRVSQLLTAIRDMRSGHVEIMALDSVALGILPEALGRFSEAYPEITYSVATAQPDEIMLAVAQGEADIGLSFCIDLHPDVRVLAEKSAPIGAVMRANHPLAGRNKVTMEDISRYPVVQSLDARGGNSIIDQKISDITAPLGGWLFTNSLPLAKQVLRQGGGIGLYTKLGVLAEIEADELSFVPLDVEFLKGLQIGLLVSAKVNMPPITSFLCNEVSKSLKAARLDS